MRRAFTSLITMTVVAALAPTVLGAPAALADSSASGAPATTYTLITGDRVTVRTEPDGRPAVTLAAAPGGARSIQVIASGAHLYVVPNDAAGFVGRPLDLSLFDVNALQPSAQPALDVQFSAGTAQHLPPGLAKHTAGYTAADPAAFGKALHTAWTELKTSGDAGPLFNGITRIARADTSTPAPPPGKLFTVTVKAFDRLGHRDTGDLGVLSNADDTNTFLAGQAYYRGEFAFSVPAGHYSIASYITTVHPDNSLDFTLASAPQIDVMRDTTVVLDARKGSRVDVTTPRPSRAVQEQLNYQRNSATGPSFTSSFTTFDATPLYATPTPQVDVGQLYFYPSFRLGDANGETNDYLYDLEFAYSGAIPADLSQTVTSDQLASIATVYHSAVPGRAEYEARFGFGPWQAVTVGAGGEVVAPTTRTEYVTARPDLYWQQVLATDEQSSDGTTESYLTPYSPGTQQATAWLGQPMVPGIEQEPVLPQACPVCRAGDTLSVQLIPFTDSGGHLQLPDPTATEDLQLYQDGTPVGQAASGFTSFALSPDPAVYRLVYDVGRDAPWWPTSTHVHTAWTFPSQERAADPLPAGWTCGGKGGGGGGGRGGAGGGTGGGSTGCSFEPLLFTHYTTSAGPDDVIAAGHAATVDVTVGHQRGAADSPVTAFAAEVSFDGGQNWQDVPVTALGNGDYRLHYDQPELDRTDGFAALHVQATDAAGSSIDQTITRAYPLTVTAPPQPTDPSGQQVQRACSTPSAPPYTQCMALVNAAAGVSPGTPTGYGPRDIQSAYDLSPSAGAGRTVAIVDAYDDPNAEADLAVYRAHYGLPPCTSASGCFRKISQRGDATLPSPDPGWGLEISLDLDAVSATCPTCNILLVEADSSSLTDLIPAVRTAAANGADVISNSYGSTGEFSGEQYLERYYTDLTMPFVVATGDYGYGNGAILIGGVSYPAASRYAIAVGGTSLDRADNARGWQESAWDGATSGCSAYIHKPGWQKDELCSMRTVADVSAVADPKTGLAVYDTFGYGGWVEVGGTSLAAPVVSAVYAMGPTAQTRYATGLYADPKDLYDVVAGSNGQCQGTYLCTAVPGYDGPTGLGTPHGTRAF